MSISIRHQRPSIPLVSESQNGLQVHEEALQYISKLPSKNCHILTIVGKTKTGKSALMNQLIHKFTGESQLQQYFPVSDCLGGGTKGISMLQQYVQLDDDNILLFLDVEGLGRFANSETYESKLFAVSLLLSTTLMYNNIGPIDEQALQNLSIFIETGKMLEKSLSKTNTSLELPSLFMILRDFSLRLEDKQGFDVTAKEYMESALEEQKGTSQTINNKNRIRRTIKQLFRERSCQTLVLPSDKLPLQFRSELRPQFKKDVNRLYSRLASHVNQKQINHRMLMPAEIIPYLQQVLESVNMNVRVPKFECILGNVYKKQIQRVRDQFKESVYKLSRQFDHKAGEVQRTIGFIKMSTDLISNEIEEEIDQLELLKQVLNASYSKARKEIEQFIRKASSKDSAESLKNQTLLDAQELRILQSTKMQKEEEIRKKIQDLRQIAELNKKACIQEQLQKGQTAQFQRIIDELCLMDDEKQLQKKYRCFIYALRDRCTKVSSKEFQSGLLKCEIAFLRRKMQLKERANNSICPSCKLCSSLYGKTSETVLKDRLNVSNQFVSELSFTSQLKNPTNLSRDLECQQMNPSKSFYVPYIILSDPGIMNVEIIRTLIKQDSRLNNYIEYVLEVVILEKRWMFNRKWKDFNELHGILTSLFHQVVLPEFPNTQLGVKTHLEVHKEEVEARRQKLEQYLRKLLEIQPIRNSRIMQKFIKINKEYVM